MLSSLDKRRLYSFLCVLMFALCQSLLFCSYPILAEKIGISLSELVAIFGVGSSLFFISAPGWTALSEKYGRQTILVICMLGLTLSLFFILQSFSISENSGETKFVVWLSRIIYGLFAGGIIPITQRIYAESDNSKLLGSFAVHAQASSIGRVIGPAVAYLAMRTDFPLSFKCIVVILSLVCFLGFSLKIRNRNFLRVFYRHFFQFRKISGLLPLAISIGLFSLAVMSVQSTLSAFLKIKITSFELFSVVNSVIFVCGNLVMIINQSMVAKYPISKLLGVGSVSFILSSLLFIWAPHWSVIALAYSLFSVGLSSFRLGVLTKYCTENKNIRSSVIAGISLIQTSGYALASILVSFLLKNSFEAVYALYFIVSLAMGLFFLKL